MTKVQKSATHSEARRALTKLAKPDDDDKDGNTGADTESAQTYAANKATIILTVANVTLSRGAQHAQQMSEPDRAVLRQWGLEHLQQAVWMRSPMRNV